MIRFMYIPNMKKFTTALEKCHGDVFLHLPDNTTCNLKSNPAAIKVLQMLPSGCANVCLSFADSRDSSAFMQYLVNAAHG